MATRIGELEIPIPTRVARRLSSKAMPQGTVILGIFQQTTTVSLLIARFDPAAPSVERWFSSVRAGVDLLPQEEAGTYIGSFPGYRLDTGLEVWHFFEVIP